MLRSLMKAKCRWYSVVYYLTSLEHKKLINRLLPQARNVGVSPDLRGYSWHSEPLKPYYDVKIPMYAVCGKYCKSGRDVYLKLVEGERGEATHVVSLGTAVHDAVHGLYTTIRQAVWDLSFSTWWSRTSFETTLTGNVDSIRGCAERCWDFVKMNAHSRYASTLSEQPYASDDDALFTSVPFMVEHKISGELLGLSGILSLDCYDYLHNIVFDLKIAAKPQEFHRLYPTGYALVFESVHEVPIDVGCTVYVNFKNDRMLVDRDLFVITDDLRSWWIEERDTKAAIVAERRDPGKAPECGNCLYRSVC